MWTMADIETKTYSMAFGDSEERPKHFIRQWRKHRKLTQEKDAERQAAEDGYKAQQKALEENDVNKILPADTHWEGSPARQARRHGHHEMSGSTDGDGTSVNKS